MNRLARHVFTFFAALAVCSSVLLCLLLLDPQADVWDGSILPVFCVVLVSVCMTGLLALAVERPWERWSDRKREDGPYYAAAAAAFIVGLASMFLLPELLPRSPLLIVLSTTGQLLATMSFSIAGLPSYRRRKRRTQGLCPQCGYDLRASRDRCPECGTAAK